MEVISTLRNVHKIILLIVLMFELPITQGSTKNSYFNIRKKELEDFQIKFHPPITGSKIDKRYHVNYGRNNHNFARLINEPELCSQHEEVFLLFAIRTIYKHFGRRQIMREQFNHQHTIKYGRPLIVKNIFLFGKSKDPVTDQLIREESNIYHDIIQEDFLDSYLNVSLKAIMGWKWTLEFCPNTEYLMLENDEVYVDIDKILPFLLKDLSMGRNEDHFAVCWANGNHPAIHNTLKQFKELPPESLYKGDFYPSYCHGYGYAAHIKVINQLYKASLTNPPFMPTDVWIGVLAEKMRIQIPTLNHLYVLLNLEGYFANPYYPVLEAFVAVTDIMMNKGNEVKVMQNIHTSMKRHWGRAEMFHKQWNTYERPDNTHGNIYIQCALYLIPTFVLMIIVCRIFKIHFFRR